MSNPTIKAALDAAARAICMCDGECYETRHGMMHGPCERKLDEAQAAIAAFLRALPSGSGHGACAIPASAGSGAWWVRSLASAVEEAARDE
jgi:hypothetical protein